MRNILIGVVAVALGACVGATVIHARMAGTIADLTRQLDETTIPKTNKEFEEAKDRLRYLEQDNEALRAQIAALQDSLSDASTARDEAMAMAEVEGAGPMEPQGPGGPPDGARGDDSRRSSGGGRDRFRGGGDRDAQRTEFAQRMRQSVNDFYAQQIAQTKDADARKRLQAMQEYTDYLTQLRESERAAQTEEEREAIRTTMRDTFDAIRTLREQQQDYMLRQLAADYGVTSTAKQDELIESLQNLQSSPFFRFGGGGPGGYGGGPGGGPGGGFGGPR